MDELELLAFRLQAESEARMVMQQQRDLAIAQFHLRKAYVDWLQARYDYQEERIRQLESEKRAIKTQVFA